MDMIHEVIPMSNIKKRILNLIEKYDNEETAIKERILEFTSRKYFQGDENFMMA